MRIKMHSSFLFNDRELQRQSMIISMYHGQVERRERETNDFATVQITFFLL